MNKKYVPILKSKSGEMRALEFTSTDVLNQINPLIEILPKYVEPKRQKTANIYTKLKDSWRGETMLVDVHYCDQKGQGIFPQLVRGFKDTQLSIPIEGSELLRVIPVLRIDNNKEFVGEACSLAAVSERGLCLRVDRRDLQDTAIIDQFLLTHGLDRKDTILVADFGYISAEDEGHYQEFITAVNRVTDLEQYKELVIASGCVPEYLKGFKPEKDNYIERLDWQCWVKYQGMLCRDSAYSDYTTRHPVQTPGFPGSKSIRYTIENQIYVPYEKKDKKPSIYLALAASLCTLEYFCGKTYSYGDEFIQKKSNMFRLENNLNPGNSTNWVIASINHHLAFVVKSDLARCSDKIKSL